jgi:hypothetical protein
MHRQPGRVDRLIEIVPEARGVGIALACRAGQHFGNAFRRPTGNGRQWGGWFGMAHSGR